MLVRAATLKDLDTLVDWGKRLTNESPRFKNKALMKSGRVMYLRI